VIVAVNLSPQNAIKRLEQHFGSREAMLGSMLITLSTTGQPTDVTFYHRRPLLDVKVREGLGAAMMYGAGPKKLQELMGRIEFSDGTVVGLDEIWTINPMPKGGIPQADLDAVGLAEAEAKVGPNGETMRHMVRATYHCKTRADEDRFLRRFIAS
jgi:hypothetical protein